MGGRAGGGKLLANLDGCMYAARFHVASFDHPKDTVMVAIGKVRSCGSDESKWE